MEGNNWNGQGWGCVDYNVVEFIPWENLRYRDTERWEGSIDYGEISWISDCSEIIERYNA